jgi:NADH-quinone oxidoreductase subunit E
MLLERLEKELGVDPGETDKSGRFTLQTVRCLGLCALSPAMKIDGRSFGRVNIDRLPEMLEQLA